MYRSGASIVPCQLSLQSSKHAVNLGIRSPFHKAVAGPRLTVRPLHASKALYISRDQSTIDFAYLPQVELAAPTTTYTMRVPILPNNFSERTNPKSHEPMVQSVFRPEISTVSANGTHIDTPSAMSDVVDNHAADIDHFELPKHVASAASKMAGASAKHIENSGAGIRSFWDGLMEDFILERKAVPA